MCTVTGAPQIESEEIDLDRIAAVDPAIALVAADLLYGMGIKVGVCACLPASSRQSALCHCPVRHCGSPTTRARSKMDVCGVVRCCLCPSPRLQGGIARKMLKILHGTPEPASNGEYSQLQRGAAVLAELLGLSSLDLFA